MTLDQLTKSIRFAESDSPIYPRCLLMTARLVVTSEALVDKQTLALELNPEAFRERAHEHLVKVLLRAIYDDRRRALAKALMDFVMSCHAIDFDAHANARDELFKAAGFSPKDLDLTISKECASSPLG